MVIDVTGADDVARPATARAIRGDSFAGGSPDLPELDAKAAIRADSDTSPDLPEPGVNTVVKVIQEEAFLDSSPDLPEIGVASSMDLEIDRPVPLS